MKLFGLHFSEKNRKLGEIFSFSLPSYDSCPGASTWCRKHCYAHRYERVRPNCTRAYQKNLAIAKCSKKFIKTMIGVLPRLFTCMRLHTAGDFFSAQYIDAWSHICTAFSQTKFWAYTRSWTSPELLPPLNQLRTLKNVQLFASIDPSMPSPPAGWRIAFVDSDPRAIGITCKQQSNKERDCLSCGHCFRQNSGNVVFQVH